MKFEELGKYLDGLEIDKRLEQVGRILEEIAFPPQEVKEDQPKVKFDKDKTEQFWMSCTPKETMHMNCAYVTKANLFLIGEHLARCGYSVEHGHNAITAKYQYQNFDIKYGKWIILKGDKVYAVLGDQEFKSRYKVTDFNW